MALSIEARNAQMKTLRKSGKTLAEIAEKFGVTGTAVWRIVTGYKPSSAKKSGASKKTTSPAATSKKTSPKASAKTAKKSKPTTAKKSADKPIKPITKKAQTTQLASKADAKKQADAEQAKVAAA